MFPNFAIVSPPSEMKGILLAGGLGTRLAPLTRAISKHLLPIYDKPLIYYPLSNLMLIGIREIALIISPSQRALYEALLEDGHHLGLEITYIEQSRPEGIAQALILAEEFLSQSRCALALGDNILHSAGLSQDLRAAAAFEHGAVNFLYPVREPSAFGVAELGADGQIVSVEEKPERPKSNWAITGLYFYDSRASSFARRLTASSRGELEITDVNREYLRLGELRGIKLARGATWLDTGTLDGLVSASEWVRATERQHDFKIACPEEIAWRNHWISTDQLRALAVRHHNEYGQYLIRISNEA